CRGGPGRLTEVLCVRARPWIGDEADWDIGVGVTISLAHGVVDGTSTRAVHVGVAVPEPEGFFVVGLIDVVTTIVDGWVVTFSTAYVRWLPVLVEATAGRL